MHREDVPECGQNASPRGKQTSRTWSLRQKKPPHWFALMWGFSKLVMPIPCFWMSTIKAHKVDISHLKKKNPHRRTNMSLRGE